MVLIFAFLSGIFAIAVAAFLTYQVVKEPIGNPKMKEIYDAIRTGAKAYLKRQYTTISVISVILTFLLYLVFGAFTSFAFIIGAFFSILAGYVGMDVATRANARTAYAARLGMDKPLKISFYGGLVMGLFNVGLSLLAVSSLYYITITPAKPFGEPSLIVGLGFGASLSALFAQLGGGIYTKAADVGADLVGKVEAGIPEDDPRNPAVIADNVGDNVGDVAGRGADLYESMTGENIGAMIIGLGLATALNNPFFVIFPLLARSLGIFGTVVGIPFVRAKKKVDPMVPFRNAMIATVLFMIVGFYFLVMYTLNDINLFYSGFLGIIASIIILFTTEYYTSKKHRPVQEIANASKTGVATNIITGFANSLETTAIPVFVIAAIILLSYHFGTQFALDTGLKDLNLGGVFGTAVATMGMLSVAGMILGMDGFGPIVDNAGGIVEMSNAPENIRRTTDAFDAAGNTTKALTKGYAIGSAGLAALLLFQAYLQVTGITSIDLINPRIIVGLFLGAMLPFLFASFAIKAVGNAAFKMVDEVRRQFRTIKGLMQGKAKPDYSRAIDISTKAAQRQMIIPGLLVLIFPLGIGFILGAEAVGGFLIGATLVGFIMAMMLNNGGAAWDNAKKYIEEGNLGGKGSEAHKASVVGDTVGDPEKDCAGPSLHVLIKLINTITLVFGALFVLYRLIK